MCFGASKGRPRHCDPGSIIECKNCDAIYIGIEGKWVPGKPHRDYLAVKEKYRWADTLNKLLPVLRKEAWDDKAGIETGKWHYRVLNHGAMVAFRVIKAPDAVTFNCELRIARKDAPTDAAGWDRWALELRTFLKFFGGADLWTMQQPVEGKCDALYLAPFTNPEVCSRCHTNPVHEPGLFKEDLCTQCAMDLGNIEARERAVKREAEGG